MEIVGRETVITQMMVFRPMGMILGDSDVHMGTEWGLDPPEKRELYMRGTCAF